MHRKSSPLYWRNQKNSKSSIIFSLILAADNAGKSIKSIIESFTVVHTAPKGFENIVPYALALIRFDNGEKLISQIADYKADYDKICIGAKVEPCLRRVYTNAKNGLINYGVKFKVVK